MANVDRVNGFKPIRHVGSPWNGQTSKFYVTAGDTTAIFVGDLVVLDGGSDGKGVRSVTQAAANGVCVGVVVGMEPTAGSLDTPQYRAASTAKYIYVVDDPNVYMEVQEDAIGGALASASVGLNANIIVAAGNTTTGTSGMELDTSTAATTNTLPLRIIEFVQREDNEVASANAKVVVAFNTHQYRSATGSTGV